HIGRCAVRAQQDEVVEVLVLPHDAALHLVVDRRFSGQRRLKTDNRIDSRRHVFWIAITATAVIEAGAPLGARFLAHRREFFLAAIAAIGMAGGKHLLRHLTMPGRARELKDNFAVPIEAKPGQAVDDGVYGRGGRPLAVGVFDPQQHLAAMPAGIQPVEQGSPGATDMQKTGGRGGKTGDDGLAHREPCTTTDGTNVSAIDIKANATSYGPWDSGHDI